ncbi:hypothetical protein DFH06DRAFT_1239871 [Mycena polygramma]|nr:hypothetical protein DFH06DRAFT_1239871 [Mycena polygramma]
MAAGATVGFLGPLFFLFPAQVLYWTGEVARRTLAAIYLLTVVSLLFLLGIDGCKGLVRLRFPPHWRSVRHWPGAPHARERHRRV